MEHRAVRKLKNPGKVKLWRLKDEKIKKMMKDGMKDAKEEPESWDDWCKYIINVAKRVCGISKGGHNQKPTWWWNEEVKEVIKEKRRLYKVWQKKKDQRSKEQYWAMKKKVKRVVAAAKEKEAKKITELFEKKNSKALQYVFKLCKQSKKDKKDIIVIVITFYSPSCLGQETAKGPFGLFESSCPPVYHTRRRLQTVPFNAERQAGKL